MAYLTYFTQRTSPAPFPKGAMFGAGFRFGIKDALAFRPGSFTFLTPTFLSIQTPPGFLHPSPPAPSTPPVRT
jgi:hypothetical protein